MKFKFRQNDKWFLFLILFKFLLIFLFNFLVFIKISNTKTDILLLKMFSNFYNHVVVVNLSVYLFKDCNAVDFLISMYILWYKTDPPLFYSSFSSLLFLKKYFFIASLSVWFAIENCIQNEFSLQKLINSRNSCIKRSFFNYDLIII